MDSCGKKAPLIEVVMKVVEVTKQLPHSYTCKIKQEDKSEGPWMVKDPTKTMKLKSRLRLPR
jgi:hypothetical protein